MPNADHEIRLRQTHRNDPCPCGSGKKYKKCHLSEDEAAQHAALKLATAQALEDAAKDEDETAENPATGADATFNAKKRDVRTHLKGQQSKGGRPVTLPRRSGKA